ncbi:MAG: glycosyltransferase [Candidatus Thalassarchaeaceae archaeon]|jgi:glycosyltransferase involved in cell wall biosynthesis|nr:glycosyltransferase [Candidatus Thalassarchaeaceae archaeon]
MKLLWITHRRLDEDLSARSRHGIATALTQRGWEVEWMAPSGGHHEVYRSKRMGFGHRSFTKSVKKKMTQITLNYDLVIVEWTAVEGAVEILLANDLPWVLMDRSPPVSTGFVGWIQGVQYRNAWNMARIFASACAVKSQYMADSQTWEKPLAIVPAGVNIDDFSITKMSDEPWIVCHGTLSKERELHRILKFDYQIRFIGSGNDAKNLKQMGAIVEGPFSTDELASKLATYDIGVMHLPNREVWRHASPLKVAEYAAAGLVIVASEVSGLEQYRDSKWIRLIPLGDDQACKGALDEFLSISSNERQQLGALARKEAEKSMTWTHCVNELHAMLREVKR